MMPDQTTRTQVRRRRRHSAFPRDAATPLLKAAPFIRWIDYECPTCGRIMTIQGDLLEETGAGALAPEGADRYPVCPECETQFECPEVIFREVSDA